MAKLSTVSTPSLYGYHKHDKDHKRKRHKKDLTVVSGLIGRFNCIGVPPAWTILAFFLCSLRSWFFFIRAISSSSLKEMPNQWSREKQKPSER